MNPDIISPQDAQPASEAPVVTAAAPPQAAIPSSAVNPASVQVAPVGQPAAYNLMAGTAPPPKSINIDTWKIIILCIVLPPLGLFLLFFRLSGSSFKKAAQQAEVLDQSLQAFAATHQFQFTKWVTLPPEEGIVFGDTPNMGSDVLCGQVANLPYLAYNYSGRLQLNGNTVTTSFVVMEVEFTNEKPLFFCRPKSQTGSGKLTLHTDSADFTDYRPKSALVPLSTEGDFPSYFELLAEPNNQVEILEIFTPDFMQLLIDKFQHYGFEMTAHHLYLYRSRALFDYSTGQYEEMLQDFMALVAKFGPVMRRVDLNIASPN